MNIALFNYSSSGLYHYAASHVNALADLPAVNKIIFFTSSYNDTSLVRTHPKIHLVTSPIKHRLSSMALSSVSLRLHQQIRREIKQLPPDVIHITDTLPLYVGLWNLLRRYPVAYTQHDPQLHTGDRFQFTTRVLQKYLRHIAAITVTHGEKLRNELIRASGMNFKKVSAVPMGNFSILLTCRHTHHKQIPRSILFFGRIVDYKGLDVLLAALLELQQAGESFELLLIGPGDLAPYQKLLAQIRNITIVNRFIPDPDVHTYFAQASIVVLPYRDATQSAVAALALPAGVPVIASRVGGLSDILTHEVDSLLVPPEDIHALKQAIARLLNNTAFRDQLAAGAKQSAKRFSWSEISPRYLAIYKSVI